MKARFSKEERQELHRQLRESIEGAIQVDSHFSEVLPTVIALKLFKELVLLHKESQELEVIFLVSNHNQLCRQHLVILVKV